MIINYDSIKEYCIGCKTRLGKTVVGGAGAVSYCPWERCERYGLLTAVVLNVEDAEIAEKQEKEGGSDVVSTQGE